MNWRRLALICFLGAAGYLAFALLAPRFNPAARWNYQLHRQEAMARAVEVARRMSGVDVARWQPRVAADHEGQIEHFLDRRGWRAETSLLAPIKTSVVFVESGAQERRLRVELGTDGRPVSYEYRERETTTSVPGVAPEATRQTADEALRNLLGADAASFALVAETKQGKQQEETRFIWERTLAGEQDVRLQAEAILRGNALTRVAVRPIFAPEIQRQFDDEEKSIGLLETIDVFIIPVTGLAAIALFFVFATRREINYQSALVLFAAAFLLMAASRVMSGEMEADLADRDFRLEIGSAWLRLLLSLLENALVSLFYALGLAMLWSAGLALARRADTRRAASFLALLRGRISSRFVGRCVIVGLACGGVLVAIPYLVVAAGLFSGLKPEHPDEKLFSALSPTLTALLPPVSYPLFGIYGFLVPLFAAGIRRRWIVRALTLPFGLLWLWGGVLDEPSQAAALLVGALLIVAADQIYWRFDFLALLTAAVAADVVLAASALLLQPSANLRTAGWAALSGLTALGAAALVVSRRGRETQTEDEAQAAPPVVAGQAAQQAERDRLMAEFGVARLAQQQMLPAAAPTIPGYALAATCRPAREVGGDLFDFLRLPDERVGIVVADVSGKGVPAALYMTLTKGLLASVSETQSEPGVILREVNRHLYQVSQRKVFVTMLLGVLDPATRTLTYARAGHNPAVWRHTAKRQSSQLAAAGLGLGMVSGKLFDRGLRPATIQLAPGDALFFYSDGIPEAMNAAGEEYGMERLLAAIERCDEAHAAEAVEIVLSDVAEFVGDTAPHDDITLVVLRVAER